MLESVPPLSSFLAFAGAALLGGVVGGLLVSFTRTGSTESNALKAEREPMAESALEVRLLAVEQQLKSQRLRSPRLSQAKIAPRPGDPSANSGAEPQSAPEAAAVIDDPDLGFAAAEASVPTIAEDPEVARAVLEATIELWEGDGFGEGAIDEETWSAGYETMVRLGFIDGSVPLEEMIVAE